MLKTWARIHKDSKNPLRKFIARSLSLKVIEDQSESNSELRKDKKMYLSEEAGLTPLLAMTQSFEDCDWLVVQEGNKRALLRVGFIISRHFEITGVIFTVLLYSHSHTHTHTHNICIFFIFYLPCCHI